MVKSNKQLKTKTNKQLKCQFSGCSFITTYDHDKKALSNHFTRKHGKASHPNNANSGGSHLKNQSTRVHEEASDPHSIVPFNSAYSVNVDKKL